MTRTNIDLDDDLVGIVMAQNQLKTKREAVEFALRHTVRRVPTAADILSLRGVGFDLSNDQIEAFSPVREW
jgi:Arc/MetJ family transcription regulator